MSKINVIEFCWECSWHGYRKVDGFWYCNKSFRNINQRGQPLEIPNWCLLEDSSQPIGKSDARRCGVCGGTGKSRPVLDVEEFYKD